MSSTSLEDQLYYHGIRALEDVKDELKQPGDFLIRTDQSRKQMNVVINVLGRDGLLNLTIFDSLQTSPKFYLRNPNSSPSSFQADTVVDFVKFYKVMSLPDGTKLKRPIHRPRWLLKHCAISYKEKDKLGSGNFCDVYKGTFTDTNKHAILSAIKVCHQDATHDDADEVIETRGSMLREAKLMSRYLHPNVIEFIGVACDHIPILLVLEYCPGGCLEDMLLKNNDISTEELTLYCFDVSYGMRYLHYHKCIHRDLAARNCLISAKGQIKIADFGLSRILGDFHVSERQVRMKRVPIRWMAPETLSKAPVYSTASDVWSFGILVYEIFNKGVAPWADDKDFKAIAKKIRNYDMPKMPESAPSIMSKLIEEKIWRESMQRVTFNEIFILLVDYVTENITTFPPAIKLVVNQIPGVRRKNILNETRKTLLENKELGGQSVLKKKKRLSSKHGCSHGMSRPKNIVNRTDRNTSMGASRKIRKSPKTKTKGTTYDVSQNSPE